MPSDYWKGRAHLNYYRRVHELSEQFCTNQNTLLDVGGGVLWGAKYLERFTGWERTSIEHGRDRGGCIDGVTVLHKDFRTWPLPKARYDLVLCLQCLEHQHDKQIPEFVRRLLACGETLIVSVPHAWRAGMEKGHPQDPISLDKFRSWFPIEPSSIEICAEKTKLNRIVAVFELV